MRLTITTKRTGDYFYNELPDYGIYFTTKIIDGAENIVKTAIKLIKNGSENK